LKTTTTHCFADLDVDRAVLGRTWKFTQNGPSQFFTEEIFGESVEQKEKGKK
jgi:hypothetical protein